MKQIKFDSSKFADNEPVTVTGWLLDGNGRIVGGPDNMTVNLSVCKYIKFNTSSMSNFGGVYEVESYEKDEYGIVVKDSNGKPMYHAYYFFDFDYLIFGCEIYPNDEGYIYYKEARIYDPDCREKKHDVLPYITGTYSRLENEADRITIYSWEFVNSPEG